MFPGAHCVGPEIIAFSCENIVYVTNIDLAQYIEKLSLIVFPEKLNNIILPTNEQFNINQFNFLLYINLAMT